MSLVLVTGATGFVGGHLCPFLIRRGYAVRGTLHQRQPENFPADMQWIKTGEIGPDTDWSAALDGVKYVIHLAGLAHRIGTDGEGPYDEFARVNTEGTRRLAEAVSVSPSVSRLLFVSSVGAVKSISEEIITDDTSCAPDNNYGRSKRAAEQAIKDVLRNSRADWCIIRPPLVYGPGNPGNMARLLTLIRSGIPLPFAAIRNKRSFLFVGNLLDAIENCISHRGASRRVFLISDGENLSTPELARRLARHAGKSSHLFPVPTGVLRGMGIIGDVVNRLSGKSIGLDSYSVKRLVGSLAVNMSSLQRATGWQPPFTLDEGLAHTLNPSGVT